MKQYNVTGMSCAACSARVEKAVNDIDGVTSCSVSLLTNSMMVEGDVDDATIIDSVKKAGYGAFVKAAKDVKVNKSDDGNYFDGEIAVLKGRLKISLIFWVILMYFSMGHMMLELPIPKWMVGNHVAMGIVQMLLTISIMVINQKFFVSGFKGLVKGAPNMDTLVALGSFVAFVYSVTMLLSMTSAVVNGDDSLVMYYMDEFYFESSATILTLITVGKMLEAIAKGKTTDALKSLMKLTPKTAKVIREIEVEIPVEEVQVGDVFIVRPGESVPVDGCVIEGESAIDESALTGESIPVDKKIGDKVSAATINNSGFIKCKATRVGEDTTLAKIIQMVSDASATKAPIARIADKVSGVFVPIVMSIAVVVFIVWLLLGYNFGFAITRAISVLVISCPCALGLATPVAIMVGNGVGARNGILYKTAASLEEIANVGTVILDKTGTITKGQPQITDIISADNKKLFMVAGSLEAKSEHPLAKAINDYVKDNEIAIHNVAEFMIMPGNGLRGKLDGVTIYGGNRGYIEKYISLTKESIDAIDKLSGEGKTPLIFASEAELVGIIAVADTIKQDSKEAVKQLKNMGIRTVMLTGDNKMTANAIGNEVGVEEIIAEVLPGDKSDVVRRYQKSGKVVMVGDGINDAPALVKADVGMAIGAGTDVAIDAADIVLIKNSLMDVSAAIRLGRGTLRNIKENLFWAFIYNVIGIPLAAGVWYPVFGLKLNPMFGAAAMSLSSFCVVTNALRLNLINIRSSKYDKKYKVKKESTSMEKNMQIKGMMCGHCEARVKKVLEELPEVKEAIVSHEKGTAVVILEKEIANDVLAKTVSDQGYEVISVE